MSIVKNVIVGILNKERIDRMEKKVILKCLVGSRGYGVYDENSDYDYRGVYVLPTRVILSVGFKYKGTHWVEDKKAGKDDTMYEIGHFIELALKCNPTILHTLKAPVEASNEYGEELRRLFPYFIDPKRMYDAFVGYGVNQRKKMIENKDGRWNKYGAAYIRQLFYLSQYVNTGDYSFELEDYYAETIRQIRNGELSPGEILDLCNDYIDSIDGQIEREGYPQSVYDPSMVNVFLLRVRKENW